MASVRNLKDKLDELEQLYTQALIDEEELRRRVFTTGYIEDALTPIRPGFRGREAAYEDMRINMIQQSRESSPLLSEAISVLVHKIENQTNLNPYERIILAEQGIKLFQELHEFRMLNSAQRYADIAAINYYHQLAERANILVGQVGKDPARIMAHRMGELTGIVIASKALYAPAVFGDVRSSGIASSPRTALGSEPDTVSDEPAAREKLKTINRNYEAAARAIPAGSGWDKVKKGLMILAVVTAIVVAVALTKGAILAAVPFVMAVCEFGPSLGGTSAHKSKESEKPLSSPVEGDQPESPKEDDDQDHRRGMRF